VDTQIQIIFLKYPTTNTATHIDTAIYLSSYSGFLDHQLAKQEGQSSGDIQAFLFSRAIHPQLYFVHLLFFLGEAPWMTAINSAGK
jgi:hypothetical protein